MQRITIDIQDSAADKILYLLQNLKDIKIVKSQSDQNSKQEDKWSYWKDEELDNFGKIAIGLSHHDYDPKKFQNKFANI